MGKTLIYVSCTRFDAGITNRTTAEPTFSTNFSTGVAAEPTFSTHFSTGVDGLDKFSDLSEFKSS